MAVWRYPSTTNWGLLADVGRRYTNVSTESQQTLSDITSTDTDDFGLRRDIMVSERDFKLFLVSVENPQPPSDRLRAAAEEYKRKYR